MPGYSFMHVDRFGLKKTLNKFESGSSYTGALIEDPQKARFTIAGPRARN